MKFIGNTIAGICAIIFVFSAVIALTFFNIERKAFSSDVYKDAFKEQGLYNTAPAIFTDLLLSSMEEAGYAPVMLAILDKNELTLVISALLPPGELESILNDAFDAFFSYLNNNADTISISLVSFKQHLASEGGVQAFTQIMLAQPECTPEQALQIALGFLSTGEGLIFCRPPQEAIGLVTPIIEVQLQQVANGLPNELTLSANNMAGISEFRAPLDMVRAVMRLTPAFPLMMLFGIIIFAVRSLKDWLQWWGYPFVITGILSFFLAVIGAPIVRLFMENTVFQGNANMPPVFLDMMRNVVDAIVRSILNPIATQGIILGLIGTGMIIGASLLKRQVKF